MSVFGERINALLYASVTHHKSTGSQRHQQW